MTLEEILARLDVFFWGPGTLLLVLGTGVFFLIRLRFLPWRNLGYALACALGRDARKASKPGALCFFLKSCAMGMPNAPVIFSRVLSLKLLAACSAACSVLSAVLASVANISCEKPVSLRSCKTLQATV